MKSCAVSEYHPGAGSVLMTAMGPSNGLIGTHRRIRASRNVSWRSFSRRVVAVSEVTHSQYQDQLFGTFGDIGSKCYTNSTWWRAGRLFYTCCWGLS